MLSPLLPNCSSTRLDLLKFAWASCCLLITLIDLRIKPNHCLSYQCHDFRDPVMFLEFKFSIRFANSPSGKGLGIDKCREAIALRRSAQNSLT